VTSVGQQSPEGGARSRAAAEELAGFEDVFAQLEAATDDPAQLGSAPSAQSGFSPTDALARAERNLEAERGLGAWLASRPTLQRWLFALAGVVVALGVGLAARRADLGVYPQLRLALELGLPLALILLTLAAWLRPLYRPPPRVDLRPLWLLLILATPLAQALLPQAHAAHAASLAGAGTDLVARAVGCLLWGVIVGLPAGLLALGLGRDGRAARFFGRSACFFGRYSLLAAALGGAAGVLSLQLHCPLTARMHLVVGHAPVPIVAALVAIGVVGLARKVRARPLN
jgi:hypothetical protein